MPKEWKMLKKTTIYLSESDIILLKKKAAILNKTLAEVIRFSIQSACKPASKEEAEIWKSLDKIWAKTSALSPEKIDSNVDKAVHGARRAKKIRREGAKIVKKMGIKPEDIERLIDKGRK